MVQPILLQELRRGIASLYQYNPSTNSSNGTLSLKEAQDFLIQFQSRNTRRKIQSFHQCQRDQSSIKDGRFEQNFLNEITVGSSWLACLAILCDVLDGNKQATACDSERLFAAQTLAHRLRKAKLVQAVDWEMEDQNKESIIKASTAMNLSNLLNVYKQWIYHLHPLVGAIIQHYQLSPTHTEERVKAELTLLTLVAIAYINACANTATVQKNLGPLLNTLGIAIAATSLRLRFTPDSVGGNILTTQDSKPIVAMITHSLSLIQSVAPAAVGHFNHEASGHCLRACLAAIPDTLLSSPDCAGGRISIDPRCLQVANAELREIDISLMWNALQKQEQMTQSLHNQVDTLHVFERWATFLPLPLEFVQQTIPLVNRCLVDSSDRSRKAALSYLIAIYESGTWSYRQVLSFSLGLSSDQQQNQVKKKKQSSKSKKRHGELINKYVTDSIISQANEEVRHRGEAACHTAVMVWDTFHLNLSNTSSDEEEGQGDGPIGCLSACATACLPHLIRNQCQASTELFSKISETFKKLCASPSQYIRSFSYEPLHKLQSSLVEHIRDHGPLEPKFEEVVVDHFFFCSLNLASNCCYTPRYFINMGAKSDETLEIERNDIRDILRSVTGSEGGSTSDPSNSRPPDINMKILWKLLRSCADVIFQSRERNELFPETVVHSLSALAKPLNMLSRSYHQFGHSNIATESLKLAVDSLSVALQSVIDAFPLTTIEIILPLSRVCNLAIAALSPMMSSLCTNQQMQNKVHQLLKLSVHATTLSLVHIPELAAASVLHEDKYDIRGAMRGPGGEDHVGCLALMRLVFESDVLARACVQTVGDIALQLCDIHGRLKLIELERGRHIVYGGGVTPKSRRILIEVLCRLEIVTKGQAGCASLLEGLFTSSVSALNSFSSLTTVDEDCLFKISEHVFDLASFSTIMVSPLFSNEIDDFSSVREGCIKVIMNAVLYGYSHFSINEEPSKFEFEWTRLRAAVFTLLLESGNPDLSNNGADVVLALNRAECEAIQMQISAGPTSTSSIFHDMIISSDAVPAGLFIRVIVEIMERGQKEHGNPSSLSNCVKLLHNSMPFVIQTIAHGCPEPFNGFEDPRPTLWESWLLATIQVMKIIEKKLPVDEIVVKELLTETCASLIVLLFYPTMNKTRDKRAGDPGMSFDGPHGLALTDFLKSFFSLGPYMLQLVAEKLSGIVKLNFGENQGSNDPIYLGTLVIGAALYRAVQGALPPWAVESIPEVYASLFYALGGDPSAFSRMLHMSMEVYLETSARAVGSVQPGHRLAGQLFNNLSGKSKNEFIARATELCKQNDARGWKRLKVIMKQLCGGKKKDTDFKQKPAYTRWRFDRL